MSEQSERKKDEIVNLYLHRVYRADYANTSVRKGEREREEKLSETIIRQERLIVRQTPCPGNVSS